MEAEAVHQTKKRSILSVLKDPTLLLPVVLTCALQGGSQLSGITAVKNVYLMEKKKLFTLILLQVFFYSVSIFQSAGLSMAESAWANLGAGFINFLMCCFSPIIMANCNRRPTVIISCFFSGIFLLMLMLIVMYIVRRKYINYLNIVTLEIYKLCNLRILQAG